MPHEKLKEIIKQIKFLPEHILLDGAIEEQVDFADAKTTLMAAIMCARADIIHFLFENHQVDLLENRMASSDRHKDRMIRINLLETVLVSYFTKPDADRTPNDQANLLDTVKYLTCKRVPFLPNKDPLEGPLLWAHFLANPELASDKMHPYYNLVPQCTNETPPEKFTAVYDYMKQKSRKDVDVFEKALKEEVAKLKSEFKAAQKRIEDSGDAGSFQRIREVIHRTAKPKEA